MILVLQANLGPLGVKALWDSLDLMDFQAMDLGLLCQALVVPVAFQAPKETLESLEIFIQDDQV